METFAIRLANGLCRHVPFRFEPCSTSDARMILGYCLILAAICAVIVGFFYQSNRPYGR